MDFWMARRMDFWMAVGACGCSRICLMVLMVLMVPMVLLILIALIVQSHGLTLGQTHGKLMDSHYKINSWYSRINS